MLFYADGAKTVKKRQIVTENDDGSRKITLGFPVCECSEYVDAKTVADMLHHAEVTIPALSKALEHAERCMSNSPATFEHDLPIVRAALSLLDEAED